MACRIFVFSTHNDVRGKRVKEKLERDGYKNIANIQQVDVYTIGNILTSDQKLILAESLTNPVTETFLIDKPYDFSTIDWSIEISFLPGVTDNIGKTVAKQQEDLFGTIISHPEVYFSQQYLLTGKLKRKDIEKIADEMSNPLIHCVTIATREEYESNFYIIPTRRVKCSKSSSTATAQHFLTINLELTDNELEILSKKGIQDPDGTRRGPLALPLPYLHTIREYAKKRSKRITDVELETLAQTWSEHCKHTIFANPIGDIEDGIFQHYIKRATATIRKMKGENDFCVSVFHDNAGIIIFDDNYLLTDKVETHNSPSALDPYGGALTGIVGVNRDAIGCGLGAKPIANRYGFCFGMPDDQNIIYRDKERTNPMLSPRRIAEGCIAGIRDGGNESGIPTTQGFCLFDKRYKGKPLVFAGTVGLLKRKLAGKNSWEKRAQPGDKIVMVGGRVGLDGIHGATFSSEALTEGSPSTAVQIGDPITQKKFSDALVKEANALGLFSSITDNGAGGLSSSVGEMARESGGCHVFLDLVPLKYPGLSPWQIWISESQERMTLAVHPTKINALFNLLKKHDVEGTMIGEFTNTGHCIIQYGSEIVGDLDLDFLHNGLPKIHQVIESPTHISQKPTKKENQNDNLSSQTSQNLSYTTEKLSRKQLNTVPFLKTALLEILGGYNCASTEYISRQYDHEVQGTSVIKPLHGKGNVSSSATALRPVLTSNRSIVLSQGIVPFYTELDPYRMTACAIDAAVGNAVAIGADPDYLAILDNYCWCSSTEPKRLTQLLSSAEALHDVAIGFGTPIISGKDSMFNDFHGYDINGNAVTLSIPPTLLISSLGVVPDVSRLITLDTKIPGDLVYVLGTTRCELGGSEYVRYLRGDSPDVFCDDDKVTTLCEENTVVPSLNVSQTLQLYRAHYRATQQDLIASSIRPGFGGLGIAFAKMALGGRNGLMIDTSLIPRDQTETMPVDCLLFSESAGRLVVTVTEKNRKLFEALMGNCAYACVGKVTNEDSVQIGDLTLTLQEIETAYRRRFQDW